MLATDLDTTVLRELERANLEVRTHDLRRDSLPEREFDLVHARLLLAWLADPDEGLRRMLAALKPGGCLLVEEMDFHTIAPDGIAKARSCGHANCSLGRNFHRRLDDIFIPISLACGDISG